MPQTYGSALLNECTSSRSERNSVLMMVPSLEHGHRSLPGLSALSLPSSAADPSREEEARCAVPRVLQPRAGPEHGP